MLRGVSSLEDENGGAAARGEPGAWLLVFAALTVALGAALVLLVRENGRLRARVAVLAVEKARAGGLELERPVAPIRLTDGDGASVTVRFADEGVGTLLLVHAAGCDACAATSGRWRALVAAAERPDVRVVCVQTDADGGAFRALDGLPASLAVPLPPSGWLAALPAVPATLLVDDRGVLVWAAYDALDDGTARSLADALASLGMRAPAPATAAPLR
jgi:hypothetical protein